MKQLQVWNNLFFKSEGVLQYIFVKYTVCLNSRKWGLQKIEINRFLVILILKVGCETTVSAENMVPVDTKIQHCQTN